MNNKRHFTKEEVFELTENESAIRLPEQYLQHDTVLETFIVPYDGLHWRLCFERSDSNGWMLDSGVDAIEVKPVETISIEWIDV